MFMTIAPTYEYILRQSCNRGRTLNTSLAPNTIGLGAYCLDINGG
jgi:hypothetical protein